MQSLNPTYLKILFVVFLSLIISGGLDGQNIDHWETIVETGQDVKYLVPTSAVPSDWILSEFDDSGWTDGIAGIGYGDGDDNTVDTCISVYVRYRFSVPDISVIKSLILDMDFDDGFVAYLNGIEIARDNMGEAFSATSWNQTTEVYINELPPGSYRYFLTEEDVSTLLTGENILCIEVHNESEGSSDLSSNTFLSAGITNTNSYFNPTPSWFIAPLTFSSFLPIMVINTNGQSIPNDPRIVADMGLIYNGPDEENFPDDTFSQYNGKISIEIRGSSSQYFFPKKSYSIELQTDSGTNNNVSLLGLPRENDFVLHGPYSDKSLLRNIISFQIYETMGHWAPRTRIIDLYIDQDYRGIYVLVEKVKIDKYRVNIKQLTEADVSSSDISGGYILQIDRTNELGINEYWTSPVYSPISGFSRNTFEYSDPEIGELTATQATYIKNWTNNLDAVLASSNYKDPNSGYRSHIDVPSFVDYLILHEFNKDVDAYRLSTFFHKASDLKGGKLHAGPPWDYNLTFGNMNYGDEIWETYKWMYPLTAGKYWWPRLMYDPYFENEVFCRWDQLKETILNKTEIDLMIDSCIQLMGSSIERNFQRWPVLGTWVWPNNFIGNTYDEEITFLKDWISDRLEWLDLQWSGQCITVSSNEGIIQALTSLTISPNPSDLSRTRIQIPNHQAGAYSLSVYDLNGREVYKSEYMLDQYSGNIFLEDISYLNKGMYLLRINGEGSFYSGKIIRE